MDQALVPTSFSITTEEEVAEAQLADKVANQEELDLKNLKDHPGYLALQKIFNTKIEAYRTGTALDSYLKSNNFEELGRKYQICRMVAEEIADIQAKVESAAAEEAEHEK